MYQSNTKPSDPRLRIYHPNDITKVPVETPSRNTTGITTGIQNPTSNSYYSQPNYFTQDLSYQQQQYQKDQYRPNQSSISSQSSTQLDYRVYYSQVIDRKNGLIQRLNYEIEQKDKKIMDLEQEINRLRLLSNLDKSSHSSHSSNSSHPVQFTSNSSFNGYRRSTERVGYLRNRQRSRSRDRDRGRDYNYSKYSNYSGTTRRIRERSWDDYYDKNKTSEPINKPYKKVRSKSQEPVGSSEIKTDTFNTKIGEYDKSI